DDGVTPMPGATPGTTNRRYTIRAYEPSGDEPHVVVDVVLHGGGPGARWAASAGSGDTVEALGPRGSIVPGDAAAAHLFVADAAGAPAALAMLEAVVDDTPARAVLVLEDESEIQPTTASATCVDVLVAVDDMTVAHALGQGVSDDVHAYLAGERRQVA